MLLLFVIFHLVKSDFLAIGLTSNFTMSSSTNYECNSTISCYHIVCDLLNTQNVTFATLIPLSKIIKIDRVKIPTNMVMFNINASTRKIITWSAFGCDDFYNCLSFQSGLLKYTKRTFWIAFAGQCLVPNQPNYQLLLTSK